MGFDTTPFPCCDIIINSAPNIPVGTTERELIRQIAELGGGNAWVNRAGDLCISQPKETTEQIRRRKYTSLSSKEHKYGGINTVVLGKADYDDDIVYQNAEAVAADGVIEWRLENNIFAEADRESFAEYIGDTYIIGLSYTPFEVSGYVDDWYLDPFDVVEIEDKNGEYFQTVILSYDTSDRIKSTIAAGTPGEMLTNYEIAGTTQKKLSYVALQVDHVNNKIESIAVDVSGMQSNILQTAEQIELKVSYGDVISAINQTAETITIDASKINLTGYITASDLSAEGETVIHGGRIDTDTLYVRHLESADGEFTGTLKGVDGEFSGTLKGVSGEFETLEAADGGSLILGDWEFKEDGLEYGGGLFDFEYSSGVAHISGTAPMQIGPYADGIANPLTLYGTDITFGVSTSNYTAVMTTQSGYNEICFRPAINETGNIGTATYVWDSGHFNNLHVYGSLNMSSLKVDLLNVRGSNAQARVDTSMVIGHSTLSHPDGGLKVYKRVVIDSMLVANDTDTYATDKVVTAGNSSGTLYQTGVTLARLYDVVGTSTAKRKHNIAPLGEDYNIFDLLEPIQFNYNNNGEKGLGLLAEDLAKLAPDLCYYDDAGEIEGIKYNSIIALLIREVQQLKERINQT